MAAYLLRSCYDGAEKYGRLKMRHALVDNSTLSAVQRVLGQIPIKNKHLIDADIPALESFIQAILFYDDLIFLDDYKESYRSSRKAFFDKLTGYRLNKQAYNLLVEQAKQLTEDVVLNVAGGKIVDGDFAPFFEMLRMNLVFTWDMASSTFYLTVKALEGSDGIDRLKYGQLSSMIYSELMEKKGVISAVDNQEPILYDSQGNRIRQNYSVGGKDGRISAQAETFFASLNWLAFRTILYTLAAKVLNIDLCLHPIRNSFQVNLLAKTGSDPSKIQLVISAMNGEVHKAINNIFEITQPFVLQQNLPMFTAWLAEKTGNSSRFIETAYELRQEKVFIDARRQLSELMIMLRM